MERADIGKWGEDYAVVLLHNKGYYILERNWQCSHHEIDIIARQNNTIVFIEVKTRTTKYISPLAAVNRRKQQYIFSAASYYIKMKHFDCDVRFDIVSIVKQKDFIEVEHIENAFYPSLRR